MIKPQTAEHYIILELYYPRCLMEIRGLLLDLEMSDTIKVDLGTAEQLTSNHINNLMEHKYIDAVGPTTLGQWDQIWQVSFKGLWYILSAYESELDPIIKKHNEIVKFYSADTRPFNSAFFKALGPKALEGDFQRRKKIYWHEQKRIKDLRNKKLGFV
jgi:hypothetical protein